MRQPVFVVNAASGGRQGRWLADRLTERFSADQVRSLRESDLGATARALEALGDDALLVACGGDGTAAAALDATWLANPRRPVAVGLIPLGTGNDLARSLGWLPVKLDPSHLDHLLHVLATASAVLQDRWLLIGAGWQRAFYNYCSLGVDARVAARFHATRGELPWLFRSSLVNKAMYGIVGLGEPGRGIAHVIEGFADLPDWTRAIVLTSIPSYAGGTCLHPLIHPGDGILEAIALGPGLSLGLAAAGVRQPRLLSRERSYRFRLARPVTAQVDGEPLRLPAGSYTIAQQGSVRVVVLTG